MRFITEDELRLQYKEAPFDRYQCPADAKITPGARQFLIDHRIQFDTQLKSATAHGQAPAAKPNEVVYRLAFNKLKETELTLRLAAAEWQPTHATLAGDLKHMADALLPLRQWCSQPVKEPVQPTCRHFPTADPADDAGECLTAGCLNPDAPHTAHVLKCQLLACKLRQVRLEIEMILPDSPENVRWFAGVQDTLNSCINRLSQWTCTINGGQTCLRK